MDILFLLACIAVVGSLAVLLTFLLGRRPHVTSCFRRGVWGGFGAAFLPILVLFVIELIEKGELASDDSSTLALGTVIFGTVVGFPAAFITAILHDRQRTVPVDVQVFE